MDQIYQKWVTEDWGLIAFGFLFPLAPFLQSMSAIVLGIYILLVLFKGPQNRKRAPYFLFFLCPMIVYLMSLLWAPDPQEAQSFIFRSLPLLLFPIGFYLVSDKWKSGSQKRLSTAYVNAAVLACIIALALAIYRYTAGDQNSAEFFYYPLAEGLSFHPTYLSLLVLTALLLLGYYWNTFTLKGALIRGCFLVLILLLLQTRMALLLLLGLGLLVALRHKQKAWIFAGLLLVAGGIALGAKFQGRLLDQSEVDPQGLENTIGSTNENGLNQRLWLWKTALEYSSEKPILGYGLRAQRVLFKHMVHRDLLISEPSRPKRRAFLVNAQKNLHNQYLQVFFDSGLVGVILFLTGLGFLVFRAVPAKKLVYNAAGLIFLAMMCTENLLDRQTGIYFFSMMLPVFYLNLRYEK